MEAVGGGQGFDFLPLQNISLKQIWHLSISKTLALASQRSFSFVEELGSGLLSCSADIKAWVTKNPSKKYENKIWRRQMLPLLPSFITAKVHKPTLSRVYDCVMDDCPKILSREFFRYSAPMFHNFVIYASPFPPVFDMFFALSPFSSAAIGLLLLLFAL